MMRQLNRATPVGRIDQYKTYTIAVPKTHTRPASCEEVGCLNYHNGFAVPVPAGDERRAFLLRTSGRPYTTELRPDGVTLYKFAAGTVCFAASTHTIQVQPELYIVRDGDWRGNPTGRRRTHVRPADWVEDFAEHLDDIHDEVRKG